MIDIKQQEELFIAIGNALEKKIVIYAIGGTILWLEKIHSIQTFCRGMNIRNGLKERFSL